MSKLQIRTPEAFAPLLEPARYKGAWGGRGSGKSHFLAELAIEDALRWPGEAGEGLRFLSFREVQKSLKESAKFLLESKLEKFGLGERDGFRVWSDRIETPGDGVIVFTGMQDHTSDSVKSYEGFHRAWGEEAQSIGERSMTLLRPTIRWENRSLGLGSEIWFSWNPMRPKDPVDRLLRGPGRPDSSIVVRANWRDNPWFPRILEEERLETQKNDPDRYGHIWEGEYARVFEGAYFASRLEEAERESRICDVTPDPLIGIRAYWDIGGTSSKADATAIWVVQFAGEKIRVLNYYEAVGQEFSTHVYWLQQNGCRDAEMILPHDGRKHDQVFAVTPQSFLRDAGFRVRVMENMGAGAAIKRVEAARRVFPRVWFDREKTQGGREALAWYHERRDDKREIGLGPEHDWSSHGADAFGAMCVDFMHQPKPSSGKALRRNLKGIV